MRESTAEDPVPFVRQFVDAKLRCQGRVPTFYDNHLRRLLAAAQGLPSGAPTDEFVGDSEQARQELSRFAALAGRPRFQDPLPRLSRDRDDAVAQMSVGWLTYKAGQGILAAISWAGRPLFKSAYDMAVYPMLVSELRPGGIIELGSGSGASAVWLADTVDAHGLDTKIISIDCRTVDVTDRRITFLNGDIAGLDALLEPHVSSLRRPWLVIEDAHVHVAEVLRYFDNLLQPGDYLIVEDSLPKRAELRAFAGRVRGRYRLDALYLDFFGENTTCAIDSIFRRVQ